MTTPMQRPNTLTDECPAARGVRRLEAGMCIILVDDGSASVGAALVAPATTITTSQMADLVSMGSGFVEIAISLTIAGTLRIPAMADVDINEASMTHGVVAGVGVDASAGVTTGISAADRAYTARLIASPEATPADLHRPGHLLPVLVSERAIEQSAQLVTGALALCRAATGVSAAVLCELVSPARCTEMATAAEAFEVGMVKGLVTVPLSEVAGAIRDYNERAAAETVW